GLIVASTGAEGDVDDAVLVVHDVGSRTELLRQSLPGQAGTVEISTDGSTVAAVAGGALVLVDVDDGSVTTVGSAQLGTGPIIDASIRPGRHQIAVGDGAGTIRLWDWDLQRRMDTALPSAAGRFGFLPDGRLAMAVDGPGIALWDVDDRTASAEVALESPPATDWAGFSVSSDGSRLVGAERDGRLYLWDLETGQLAGDPANRPGTVQGVSFSPRGGVLAVSGSDGDVVLYDPVDDRPIGDQLHAHSGRVVAPAFTADGEMMVTGGDDGMIGLWESNRSGGLLATDVRTDFDHSVRSADGTHVLVHTKANTAELRTASLDAPGTRLPGLDGRTTASTLGLSGDGRRALLNNGIPGNVEMYVVDTGLDGGKPRTIWRDEDRRYKGEGMLSRDGQRLTTMTRADDEPMRIVVLDVTTGDELANVAVTDAVPGSFNRFGGPILALDGTVVDVATSNGVARLAADDLAVLHSVRSPFPIQSYPVAIPGTSDLVVVGTSGELARWDMARGEIVATGRTGDPSAGGALAVSPDGKLLVTYSYQSYRLGLFDLETLAPIGRPMPVGDLIFIPGFTPDGVGLTGNGLFNQATTWSIDPGTWFDRACRAAGRNLTTTEWLEHLGPDEPYRPTCERWPGDA
ncbi:MAG TPA: WD40 repeat domain-containing protein, partial [Acidimicrobiales bacterium]